MYAITLNGAQSRQGLNPYSNGIYNLTYQKSTDHVNVCMS